MPPKNIITATKFIYATESNLRKLAKLYRKTKTVKAKKKLIAILCLNKECNNVFNLSSLFCALNAEEYLTTIVVKPSKGIEIIENKEINELSML